MKPNPYKESVKKCEKCLAHYTGNHVCDGLMSYLLKKNGTPAIKELPPSTSVNK